MGADRAWPRKLSGACVLQPRTDGRSRLLSALAGQLLGRMWPRQQGPEHAHLRAAVALFPGFVAGRLALAKVRAATRYLLARAYSGAYDKPLDL